MIKSFSVITKNTPLLLGSASPRRRDLLTSISIPIAVAPGNATEERLEGESPDQYLERVTLDKWRSVRAPESEVPGAVLVADTIVTLRGEVFGKPTDDDDARRMLRLLSGTAHEVRTRFALGQYSAELPAHQETVVTRVFVRTLDDVEVENYVATGEGRDKAGGYAIQGQFAFAIQSVSGSYTNVVGLPICEVVVAMKNLGLLHAPLSTK